MKKFFTHLTIIVLTIVAIQLVSYNTFAQNETSPKPFKGYVYLVPNIGLSQYYGDFNKDDFWNKKQKFGFGGVLGYQLSPLFGVRGQFMKTNLYSERADNDRKLSSNLWDAGLNLTVNINEIFAPYNEKRFLNFYVFSGAGLASYKSKLQVLSTDALLNEHTAWQKELFVPVGGGATMRLNYNFALNLEYGDHMTFKGNTLDFTDYAKKNDHYSLASLGLKIRFGAEDTDGDGVKDKDDLCPTVPGKVELAGCPDKDNDGVADKDDACPDIAGKPEFKGCPDTDGDGIIDSEDACPTVAGKKELNGCPDKDGDGIADKDDKCPDVPGKKELNGCPDRDGDGIADKDDLCPDVKGLAKFNGCPDTDGDGIADKDDKCPDVFGVASNFGCPEEKKFEYFKVVYFATDKSVVLTKYTKDIEEVVAIMKEHVDVSVSVEGHADAQGSDAYNLRLSEKRADYVINSLVKKGIAKDRLVKKFFGESVPASDNNTAAGRALNRRVEIKTIK